MTLCRGVPIFLNETKPDSKKPEGCVWLCLSINAVLSVCTERSFQVYSHHLQHFILFPTWEAKQLFAFLPVFRSNTRRIKSSCAANTTWSSKRSNVSTDEDCPVLSFEELYRLWNTISTRSVTLLPAIIRDPRRRACLLSLHAETIQ